MGFESGGCKRDRGGVGSLEMMKWMGGGGRTLFFISGGRF